MLLVILVNACGGGGGDGTGLQTNHAASIQAVSNTAAASTPAGTTSPVTLVAKVIDGAGSGMAGVTIAWTVSAGTITPATSTSDASGQATAQWTLGTTAGTQTAAATAAGVSTSALFTANVVAGALAKIVLIPDSIVFGSVGETAIVTATATDAFNNFLVAPSLTFTTDDPTVATVSGTGTVTLQGAGRTNIRATSGAISATIPVRQVCFGIAALNLAVGAVTTLTGSAAQEFCVQGSTGSEFVAIPFYAPTTGGSLSLTIKGVGGTTTTGPPTPSISTPSFRSTILADGRELTRDYEWERQFRERSLQLMTPRMAAARQAMQASPVAGRRNLSFAVVPSVGDIITLNVNANSAPADACDTPINHGAQVMAVSNKAIVVNDTLNPPGFSSSDFQEVANAFDTLVYPTDTQNFGDPTDIDSNGRVILLFTTVVNALTPASNTTSFIGGFFYNRDIFPKIGTARAQGCATSNVAEMFYLLAPDPNGTINGHKFSTSQVKTLTIGTVAHEFQHLINASRHLYINTLTTAFETVFLDEGLAHEAEELTFYAASGLSPRQNLDSLALSASPTIATAANNYALQNQRRFREYLKAPDINSPYANNDSLATRGATWSFLRYATDRVGGTDSNIWFNLVNPNTASMTGLNNLARVFGSNLATQIRDWSVANYVDDAVAGVPNVDTHPSWNTRSVEAKVFSGVFPLKTQQLVSGTPLAITLMDGGSSYVRFGVPNGSKGGAIVTSAAGALPATLSLSIIRTK